MNHSISISVVSPVYCAAPCIHELHRRLSTSLRSITPDYEIILVNDASPDNSWDLMSEIALSDEKVKAINLSRNFGQHYAITAGLTFAKKEWVVVMDCDLQDRPEEIPNLVSKALSGFDIVLAQRIERSDNLIKRSLSSLFYFLLQYLTGIPQDPSVANFGIYKSNVISAVLSSKDHIRFFPSMIRWVGFKRTQIPVEHASRFAGETSYNFRRMLRLAVDTILAYSDKPLRLTVKLGFLISSISFCFGVYTLILALKNQILVLGYASIMVSIWFFGGLILLVLGIVGLYIGKIFEQVKGRPSFIVSETRNADSL